MSAEQTPGVVVDRALVSDVPAIQDIFYKTWLSTYPNEQYAVTVEDIEDRFKDRFSEEKLQKRRVDIENNDPSRVIFVARDNATVVGLCRVEKHEGYNQLSAFYVLPEYQGQGIGFRLWEKAKKHLDMNVKTIVHVVTYNQKAIDFYTKLGFEDTGKRFSDDRFRLKSGAVFPEMEMVLEGTQQ